MNSYLFDFDYFCLLLLLLFFTPTCYKKPNLWQKTDKIAKIEEVKIHIFCETEINFR